MANWGEFSGHFAEKEWTHSLDPGVLSFLAGLPENRPLILACSGGADSVFLALALISHVEGISNRLHLAHFHHGVRGTDADEDANFVRDMAAGLDIPFHLGKPESPLQKDEASLREARYSWMVGLYHRLDAGGLLLGHHADDVVESLLMSVLVGSGPAGLSSPMPVKRFSDGHVRLRPMLSLKHGEITAFLKQSGVPWCEDSSNHDTAYLRNWLRKECIPSLRRRIPQDIYSGTQRTRQLMEECLVGLDDAAQDLGINIENQEHFHVNCLAGRSRALIRRAFMSWWIGHHSGQILGKGAVDKVVELIQAGRDGGSVIIGKRQALSLDAEGFLRISQLDADKQTGWPGSIHWSWKSGPVFLPGGGALMAELVHWPENGTPYLAADPETTAWLNWESPMLHVRQWEAGDRYKPLGAPGKRKLQDMFVDAKLSLEQKRNKPVLTDIEGAILWVPGFPPTDDRRIIPGTNSGLKLTYKSQWADFA